MIIGIDASTVATGFAAGGPKDGSPRGGVWKLSGCDELGGKFDHTILNLGRSMMETARVMRPIAFYIEAPFTTIDREHSRQTAAALAQLTGGMRLAAALVQARVELCAVFNVRKTFGLDPYLGGREAKAIVMAKLDAWGWTYADDNEADAKLTWAYGMKCEYPGWAPNAPLLFDDVRVQA